MTSIIQCYFGSTDSSYEPRGNNATYVAELCRNYIFMCGENVTVDCPDLEVGVFVPLWHVIQWL